MLLYKWVKRNYIWVFIIYFGAIVLPFGNNNQRCFASEKSYSPMPVLYENQECFSVLTGKTDAFSCGNKAGSLVLSGSISNQKEMSEGTAYAATDNVIIGYDYSGMYKSESEDNWYFTNSDSKYLDDIKLSKKVSLGTILIQRSSDRIEWENVSDPIYNCFDSKKIDFNSLYTIPLGDIEKGYNYRVLVLYEMRKKTGTEKGMFGRNKDVFSIACFVEEYDFYVCYGACPIKIFDVTSRSEVSSNGTVENGFYIDDCGISATTTITKTNDKPVKSENYAQFTTPGIYTITSTTPIGDVFSEEITVSEGLSTHDVVGTKYENEAKKGYVRGDINTSGVYLSSLMIGQKAGTTIKTSTVNDFDAYGVTGDKVYLGLKLDKSGLEEAGFEVLSDDWGKKKKEGILGTQAGQVATGALIIQKSINGTNWTDVDRGKYSSGLYTTDFYNHYGDKGDIWIYSPDGTDVLKGIYLRVIYAYETKPISGKEKKRCIEEYTFYLCCDELDAVTIHNLSATDKLEEVIGDYDETTKKIYRSSESMSSGAVTVSGFSIEKGNPTATYSVKKDGESISIPADKKFTETGKYEIQVSSAVGSKKTTIIYVDRMDIAQTMTVYFGKSFIEGKRIFSEGQYPVFEAGLSKCHFASISDTYQPLYGSIKNNSTGEVKTIDPSRDSRDFELKEAGEYVVTLSNNPTFKTDTPSGDNKQITMHFRLISKGSAPGPVVNKKRLEDNMLETMSGMYPKFYGLYFSSATKGTITLAFTTWEDARNYSYEYERGTIENLSDGSIMYRKSTEIGEKDKYDSYWDLTPALYQAAESSVHDEFFDMSDESTYLTLKDSVISKTDNIREYALEYSVTAFAEGQKEKFTKLDSLPIINDVPYAYINPGNNKEISRGFTPYKFIKDKYECDSSSVDIYDIYGKKYPIKYQESVEAQLQKMGCPSGVITISENTIYGDSTSYKALYFADKENTASIRLSCYQKGENKPITLSQKDEGRVIDADAFSIEQITDSLDPYDLVIVTDEGGRKWSFVEDQKINGAWANKGEYKISVVNRIGNKFNFTVKINSPELAAISFKGIGTEEFEPCFLREGDKNVELPVPERYGYVFSGYCDDEGMKYKSVIDEIQFSGSKVLTPIWESQKADITLEDPDGNIIGNYTAEYGTYFEIPDPEIKGYEIENWSFNGQVLSENRIRIQSLEPITLVASMVEVDSQQDSNKNNTRKPIPRFIVVGVLLGVVCLIVRRKKKRKAKSEDEVTPSAAMDQIDDDNQHEIKEDGENEDENSKE